MSLLDGLSHLEELVFVYLSFGCIVAVLFYFRGLNLVEPANASSSLGFRVFIGPGLVLLWPLVLRLWILRLRRRSPILSENHGREWQLPLVCGVVFFSVLVMGLAVAFRESSPASPAPSPLVGN